MSAINALNKLRNKFSLKDKFIIISLAIYLFSTGLITWIIGVNAKSAIMDRTFEQLVSIRSIKKRQIETFFQDRLNSAKNISHYFNNIQDINFIKSEISYILLNDMHFESALLYNKSGVEFFEFGKNGNINPDFSENIKNHLKKNNLDFNPKIIDIQTNPNNKKPELFIILKALSKNGNEICVALKIPISLINYIMLENNPSEGLGNSGESYLIGEDLLMRSGSRFIENSILNIKVNTTAANKAYNNETGALETYDYRNVKVLSAFTKLSIPNLNWALLAEIDYEEANVLINMIVLKIILLASIISIFIFVIIYIASHRIVSPIIALINATKDIRHGKFNKMLDISSKDEIGELSRAFNSMTISLRKKNFALKKERLKRFAYSIDAQEKERTRLARELHDGLGQMMVGLKFMLENIDDNCQNVNETLSDAKLHLDLIIDEIRHISNDLTPNILKELGLKLAISNLCAQIRDFSGINVEFESNLNESHIDEKKSIYIYRIVQEALNNIVKYSKAQNVEIALLESASYHLAVFDDGVGFNVESALKGNSSGLYNIRERALSLSGSCEFESTGKGALIRVTIPK